MVLDLQRVKRNITSTAKRLANVTMSAFDHFSRIVLSVRVVLSYRVCFLIISYRVINLLWQYRHHIVIIQCYADVHTQCCCCGSQANPGTLSTWWRGLASAPTRVLQRCYKSVTIVLQECYKSVTRVLQECSKRVTRVLQECSLECYKSVRRVLQTAAATTSSKSPATPRVCRPSVVTVMVLESNGCGVRE